MPKRHLNLIQQIADLENLRWAHKKTSKGKKDTYGYLEFKEYSEVNLAALQEELLAGAYRIGDYRQFTIYEPKPRLISALDFKDRLVQHALCNIIAPIFEASFLPNSFACRVGLGTHAGVKYVQANLRRHDFKYFLKTDFSKYFASIDRATLHGMIERKIGCAKTLGMLRETIPPTGTGIPIGSLTSQLFANVYGDLADRFIHFQRGQRIWARYMDDIIVLGDDKQHLLDLFGAIEEFAQQQMHLNISKWQVSPTSRGVNFLGYRIWKTHKLLRKDSVIRAKRKVRRYQKHGDQQSLQRFIASWSGHAKWANCHNLITWMEKNNAISINRD